MNTGGAFPYEVVSEAGRLIANGANRQTAITQFKIKWGLNSENAERLYNEARKENVGHVREAGTKDLLWGFVALAIGGVITAITYLTSAPGESYYLFWGPMVYGAYRLIKGFTLKFRSSVDKRGVLVWAGVAVVLSIGLITASVLTIRAGELKDPAESDFVWLPDDETVIGSDMRLTGLISNENDDWTIVGPSLMVAFYNANGVLIRRQDVGLAVPPIGPGQSQRYSTSLALPAAADSYDTEIRWDWVIE